MRLPCRIILASLAILAASLLAAPRASFSQTSAQTSAQTSVQQAQDVGVPWGDAVHVFTDKIAAAIGAGRAISLDVVNISRLSSVDVGSIERQLQAALGSAGFPIAADPQSDVRVHVTLSEGSDGYLWVAEIHSQSGDQFAMMNAHAATSAASRTKPVPVLRETFLLRQAEPILDFAIAPANGSNDGSPLLFILEPDRIDVLRRREATWTKIDAAPIAHSRPWPRDLRGEIVVSRDASGGVSGATSLRVYLPEVFCSGSRQSKLEIDCQESAGLAWPLGGNTRAAIAPDRNYFSISSNGAKSAWPPSYSIASNSDVDRPLKILTAVNGNAQLFASSPENPAASFWRWGDEFASIQGCDDSWNVVATGVGDWTQRDYLLDYEIADKQATAAGQLLEFSGPIVALWSSDDGKSVRAVSRNLQTGMYEASLINLYCGN
jgi:hypothetical protein